MNMKKPDLNRIWQTWIRIAPKKNVTMDDLAKIIPNTIRKKIAIFQELAREGKVDWFCFLIHDFSKDPDIAYFHVRFTKAEGKK